jgi:DNA-binding NarL/FixJ family response regulator
MDRTRILIADDQPLIRMGLHTLLNGEQDLEVVGEVARGDEVESAIDRLAPNVLILDITLPELDAVDTTRHVTKHHTEVQILILTACDDQEVILGLLEAGATGYVLKADSPASLLLAIRTVAKGHTWLSSRVANVLVSKPGAPWTPPMVSQGLPALTGREREVLALVGQGLSNRQIAETLCITRGTVRSHLNRVYDKIGVDGRSQAMHYAMMHGLVRDVPEE